MDKRRVIGLTGGIASGKSEVLRLFARAGIPTLSSDDLAHRCILRGTPAYRKIVKHFGTGILGKQKQIDRPALARIVFNHPKERRRLEKMVHPCVIQGLRRFAKRHRGLVVLDIPLLFEVYLEPIVDEVVVVYATREQQIQRLKHRNGMSRADALRRIAAQTPLSIKVKKADWVLRNNGSLRQLRENVKKLLTCFRSGV